MTTRTSHYRTALLTALVGLVSLSTTLGGALKTEAAETTQKSMPTMSHGMSKPTGKASTSAPAKSDGLPHSVPDIWKAVQAGRVQLDQLVTSGKLDGVHEVAFWVRDLVAALPQHSKLSKESTTRLQDSATRVAQIASALDEAGDAGDKAAVTTQLTRLDSVLQIVKGLYPADQTPALEFTCPMHPEVRQSKPGKCPKCGMNLVPDAVLMSAAAGHSHGSGEGAPHADHHPKHGGQFAMQGNYHLELVAASGRLTLYVYDAWTKALNVSAAKATATLELSSAVGTTREQTIGMTPAEKGAFLAGQSPDIGKATAVTVMVVLPDTSLSMTFPLPGVK